MSNRRRGSHLSGQSHDDNQNHPGRQRRNTRRQAVKPLQNSSFTARGIYHYQEKQEHSSCYSVQGIPEKSRVHLPGCHLQNDSGNEQADAYRPSFCISPGLLPHNQIFSARRLFAFASLIHSGTTVFRNFSCLTFGSHIQTDILLCFFLCRDIRHRNIICITQFS